MKRFLAPILLVVLLFPSLALGETVKWDDLVEREGVYYKKFTDVPFTGKVTGQYQGKIRNGKKDGSWVSYYKNGQLSFKGTYKDGKEDGPCVSYYENGKLSQKGEYKNGKREGHWVFFDQNDSSGYQERVDSFKIGEQMFEIDSGTYKDGVKVD